jgi:hypothetical protein
MACDEFSDAQILSALRKALFFFADAGNANEEFTVAGRSYRKSDVEKIQRMIDLYESRVAAASSPSLGGGGILVRKNDRCDVQPGYGFLP